MSAPFVGRHREVDQLTTLTRRARADRAPAAALVKGEPGSGKTRLLNEVLALIEPGASLRLAGFEPMQQIPLAAVGELLRRLARVPSHGSTLDGLVFGKDAATARDPLRIFEAAHRALVAFGPLVLVIDDLQWIDERSLALVQYLLRAAGPNHQSLVIIASARPSPAAGAFESGIESDLPAARLSIFELAPLLLDDGVALARAIDRRLTRSAAIDLWRRAAGSPFWLEELARGTGGNDRASLIGERLRTLTSDAGVLLGALAIAARPIFVEDVAAALEWDVNRVRGAARELVSRGLALDVSGSLRPTHDLLREAASAALPLTARRRLHARLASSIEAEAGDDLQLLGEALQHREAAGLPAVDLALRLLSSPQRRLLGGEGLQLLASISDGLPRDAPERVTIDSALGELAAILGAQELALDRWSQVSEHTTEPSMRQEAEIAAARAAYRLGRREDAHAHLDRARAAAPMIAEVAVSVDALQADIELWLDHETAAGSRTAQRALEAAEAMTAAVGGTEGLTPGARRAYLAALEAAGDGALQEDRGDDVVRLSETSALVARQVDEESYLSALMRGGFAFRPLGMSREAQQRFRQAWEVARRLVLPMAMVEAGHGLARSLRDQGSLQAARAIASEVAELERRVRNAPRRWGNANSILHTIELSLGDPTAALRSLRDDARSEPDPHYRLAIHQTLAAWQARFGGSSPEEVDAEVTAARSAAALARCPRCSAELSVISAEILARIGHLEAARRELADWEGGSAADYPMRRMWRMRTRAAIAGAAGDIAAATATLEALIDALTDAGLLEDLLWARIDLGRMLAPTDRGRAVAAFTQAAALADRIGAQSQGRLATQALRRLGVRAWRRGPASDGEGLEGLSDREREVARHIADGGSNREIAEALLVSPKTVERHVTNVLSKLGLRNRTELASLVRSAPVRGSPDE